MNREEAYNFVEDHLRKAFDDVKALYEQEQSREAEIRKKVHDACGAYFADLRAKKERIIQQIAALNSRTAEIGTEKEQQHQATPGAKQHTPGQKTTALLRQAANVPYVMKKRPKRSTPRRM